MTDVPLLRNKSGTARDRDPQRAGRRTRVRGRDRAQRAPAAPAAGPDRRRDGRPGRHLQGDDVARSRTRRRRAACPRWRCWPRASTSRSPACSAAPTSNARRRSSRRAPVRGSSATAPSEGHEYQLLGLAARRAQAARMPARSRCRRRARPTRCSSIPAPSSSTCSRASWTTATAARCTGCSPATRCSSTARARTARSIWCELPIRFLSVIAFPDSQV